jgi:8-oxo-dGTP diphosphatase
LTLETPRQAAAREFVEETGQPTPDLTYAGVAMFRLMPDRRVEYAAVYRADLRGRAPFVPNDEAEEIMWWDGTDIPNLSQLDTAIARLTHPAA